MKFFLVLLVSFHLHAQVAELKENSADYFVEVNDNEDTRDKSAWNIYKTDDCSQYNYAVENEEELRQTGLRRCSDGTVSFVQPKARGAGGWEGKCGQTFASNAMFSFCGLAYRPESFDGVLRDITPGVRPNTLRKGLRNTFQTQSNRCPGEGTWAYNNYSNKERFIAAVKQRLVPKASHARQLTITRNGKSYRRNPVATLIQNPGGRYLHWVAVVDVLTENSSCQFVVNHWDNQYLVPCQSMAKWSGDVGKTYPIILKSFSIVSLKQ